MADVLLFAGPTGHGLAPSLRSRHDVEWLPPVQRGDVELLLRTCPRPGVLLICDGIFGSAPAVSHAELCHALDAGWQVWGVASMGAIRAFELREQGMQGFGYVHRQFFRFEDFSDDELCQLHLPGPSYEPLTEALVNVRYALEVDGETFGIEAPAHRRIVAGLRRLWFGDRTAERLCRLLIDEGGLSMERAVAFAGRLQHNRVKTHDLAALLQARPWKAAR